MIKISDLKKKFKDKVVLDNLSLEFNKGITYGLLGNNGVGKTTILKILFNEYSYDSGSISLDGNKLTKHDYKRMYLFIENNELPKKMRVSEHLKYILSLNEIKMLNSEEIKRLSWVFDYESRAKVKIKNLSAGEKKMWSLFLLFILDPEIIFFDEPTANLDAENKKLMIDAMEVLKERNKTIVIITHLIEEVEMLLDYFYIIKDGKVMFKDDTKKSKNIKEVYYKYIGIESTENKEKIKGYFHEQK